MELVTENDVEIFKNLASYKINRNYIHSTGITPVFLYKTKNILNNKNKLLKNSSIFTLNSNQIKKALEHKNSVIYKTNYKLYNNMY